MELNRAIDQLSALAHSGRLSVFRLLVKAAPEGLSAGDIARQVGIPANTLSAQLTILNNAGLVHNRREGRSIIYSADTETMSALILYLMDDCCGGRPEVCGSVLKAAQNVTCC